MNCSYDGKGWHLCDIYWCVGASPTHWHREVYASGVLKCLPKTEHGTWGKEGHSREDKGPPSEVKLLNCLSACSQGLLRGGREGVGRKQEGLSGMWRERDRQKIWERRKNGDSMNCLASSKGIPWNSITFCFFGTHPRLSFALWKIAWRPRIAVDHRILSEFLVELWL